MILIEKALLELAIRALETHTPHYVLSRGIGPINALRKALEQPEWVGKYMTPDGEVDVYKAKEHP